MNEYFFLFGLAFIWIIFATIQDLRKREISNWLNFSLIAFALAYRAFYATSGDYGFFLYGFIGAALFVGLGYGLYYGRAFAGGDAKLLMGLGAVLPFESLSDYLSLSVIFIILLFGLGSIYSIIYTLFLANRNRTSFTKEFKVQWNKWKLAFVLVLALYLIFVFIGNMPIFYNFFTLLFLILLFLVFIYTRAVEKSCFIKNIKPEKLTEGDWLLRDVKVSGKIIKATVHGLTWKDIALLRKARKSVWIKEGVPFAPAFLFTFILFVIYFVNKLDVLEWLYTI